MDQQYWLYNSCYWPPKCLEDGWVWLQSLGSRRYGSRCWIWWVKGISASFRGRRYCGTLQAWTWKSWYPLGLNKFWQGGSQYGWTICNYGQTGHRLIGWTAPSHLKPTQKKKNSKCAAAWTFPSSVSQEETSTILRGISIPSLRTLFTYDYESPTWWFKSFASWTSSLLASPLSPLVAAPTSASPFFCHSA